MQRPRLVVLGSTHMDFIVYVDRLPLRGETVMGSGFLMAPGGKGANQAVAASKLGADTYLISRVGSDHIGELLIENLKRKGVKVGYVKVSDVHSGVALIIVERTGENVIAVAPGADRKVSPRDVDSAKDVISRSRMLLSQLEVPLGAVEHAFELARDQGTATMLNPAPARELPDALLRNTDIMTPNLGELEKISGVKVEGVGDAVKAGRALIRRGVGRVVVTMGGRGALVVEERGYYHVPAFKVEVVDTTGAGDAFSGGLAYALSRGMSLREGVKFANLVAAAKVTRRGAQEGLPSMEELAKLAEALGVSSLLG